MPLRAAHAGESWNPLFTTAASLSSYSNLSDKNCASYIDSRNLDPAVLQVSRKPDVSTNLYARPQSANPLKKKPLAATRPGSAARLAAAPPRPSTAPRSSPSRTNSFPAPPQLVAEAMAASQRQPPPKIFSVEPSQTFRTPLATSKALLPAEPTSLPAPSLVLPLYLSSRPNLLGHFYCPAAPVNTPTSAETLQDLRSFLTSNLDFPWAHSFVFAPISLPHGPFHPLSHKVIPPHCEYSHSLSSLASTGGVVILHRETKRTKRRALLRKAARTGAQLHHGGGARPETRTLEGGFTKTAKLGGGQKDRDGYFLTLHAEPSYTFSTDGMSLEHPALPRGFGFAEALAKAPIYSSNPNPGFDDPPTAYTSIFRHGCAPPSRLTVDPPPASSQPMYVRLDLPKNHPLHPASSRGGGSKTPASARPPLSSAPPLPRRLPTVLPPSAVRLYESAKYRLGQGHLAAIEGKRQRSRVALFAILESAAIRLQSWYRWWVACGKVEALIDQKRAAAIMQGMVRKREATKRVAQMRKESTVEKVGSTGRLLVGRGGSSTPLQRQKLEDDEEDEKDDEKGSDDEQEEELGKLLTPTLVSASRLTPGGLSPTLVDLSSSRRPSLVSRGATPPEMHQKRRPSSVGGDKNVFYGTCELTVVELALPSSSTLISADLASTLIHENQESMQVLPSVVRTCQVCILNVTGSSGSSSKRSRDGKYHVEISVGGDSRGSSVGSVSGLVDATTFISSSKNGVVSMLDDTYFKEIAESLVVVLHEHRGAVLVDARGFFKKQAIFSRDLRSPAGLRYRISMVREQGVSCINILEQKIMTNATTGRRMSVVQKDAEPLAQHRLSQKMIAELTSLMDRNKRRGLSEDDTLATIVIDAVRFGPPELGSRIYLDFFPQKKEIHLYSVYVDVPPFGCMLVNVSRLGEMIHVKASCSTLRMPLIATVTDWSGTGYGRLSGLDTTSLRKLCIIVSGRLNISAEHETLRVALTDETLENRAVLQTTMVLGVKRFVYNVSILKVGTQLFVEAGSLRNEKRYIAVVDYESGWKNSGFGALEDVEKFDRLVWNGDPDYVGARMLELASRICENLRLRSTKDGSGDYTLALDNSLIHRVFLIQGLHTIFDAEYNYKIWVSKGARERSFGESANDDDGTVLQVVLSEDNSNEEDENSIQLFLTLKNWHPYSGCGAFSTLDKAARTTLLTYIVEHLAFDDSHTLVLDVDGRFRRDLVYSGTTRLNGFVNAKVKVIRSSYVDFVIEVSGADEAGSVRQLLLTGEEENRVMAIANNDVSAFAGMIYLPWEEEGGGLVLDHNRDLKRELVHCSVRHFSAGLLDVVVKQVGNMLSVTGRAFAEGVEDAEGDGFSTLLPPNAWTNTNFGPLNSLSKKEAQDLASVVASTLGSNKLAKKKAARVLSEDGILSNDNLTLAVDWVSGDCSVGKSFLLSLLQLADETVHLDLDRSGGIEVSAEDSGK